MKPSIGVASIFNSAAAFNKFPKAKYVCFAVQICFASSDKLAITFFIMSLNPPKASVGTPLTSLILLMYLSTEPASRFKSFAKMNR
ncbi:hypothetical protein D3C72_2099280 [compost metagenome]